MILLYKQFPIIFALIIILIKAGLTLDISDLKKVGRPAIMMSFMPAVVEMVTVGLIAPLFFDITHIDHFYLDLY